MPSAIVIGSGPAAAGVLLALTAEPGWAVTVVDMGIDLDPETRTVLERLAAAPPREWAEDDVARVARRAADSRDGGLPETKLIYGSDYVYRDAGQLSPLAVGPGVHPQLISAAYGGFSSAWSAQVLPFPETAFRTWPFGAGELAPHYAAILRAIPFAATTDDLAEELPLYADPLPPLPLSAAASAILERYRRNRRLLRRRGLTLGRARLAVKSAGCTLCGLCMSGCPYSLIYSSAETVGRLRAAKRITYLGGLRAVRIDQQEGATEASVTVESLSDGSRRTLSADRVVVACGAIGTSRLVLESRRLHGVRLSLQESAQIIMPLLSLHGSGDPRDSSKHAMGELSMLMRIPELGAEPVHLQYFTYNPAFLDALPGPMREGPGRRLLPSVLGRLSVILGYLPSGASRRVDLRLVAAATDGAPGVLSVEAPPADRAHARLVRKVCLRLAGMGPWLDLYPIMPKVILSGAARSYHWGSAFPHRATPGALDTDRWGRLQGWDRVHLVDASVLPSIASTTFTLTVMANSHRIGSEVVRGLPA